MNKMRFRKNINNKTGKYLAKRYSKNVPRMQREAQDRSNVKTSRSVEGKGHSEMTARAKTGELGDSDWLCSARRGE